MSNQSKYIHGYDPYTKGTCVWVRVVVCRFLQAASAAQCSQQQVRQRAEHLQAAYRCLPGSTSHSWQIAWIVWTVLDHGLDAVLYLDRVALDHHSQQLALRTLR